MIRKLLVIILTAGIFLVAGAENALKPSGEPIEWAQTDGYAIILPDKPTKKEQFAAELLQTNIQKATGVSWSICSEKEFAGKKYISIGDTFKAKQFGAAVKLEPDGYQIYEQDGNWFFTGGERRGPINAVIAFLEEDLGWRWYCSDGIPAIPDWSSKCLSAVPRSFSPCFAAREIYIREAFASTDWLLLNRMTPYFQPMGKTFNDATAELGGTNAYAGAHVHTFARYAPDKDVFDAHPEYFAMRGGRRVPNNLCLTHPETVKLLAARLLQQLESEPGTKMIDLSQNDGTGIACECPDCKTLIEKEGSPSGAILYFVNNVAKIVGESRPDVTITTLAYIESYRPPKTIRPAANVAITLCTDTHTWCFPYFSMEETTVQNFSEALKSWLAIGAKIYLWEYMFGHTLEWMDIRPVEESQAARLRYLSQFPLNGVMLQDDYCSVGSSLGAMKNWMFSKLLWNPMLDWHRLELDFNYGVFGDKAGAFMQQYCDLVAEEARIFRSKNPPVTKKSPLFTASEDFLPKALEILANARAEAKTTEAIKLIEQEQLCLLYQRLNKGPVDANDKGNYKNDIEKMQLGVQKFGIVNFQENFAMEARFKRWRLSVNRGKVVLPTPGTKQFWLDVANLPNTEGKANASIVEDPDSESGFAILQPPFSSWTIQFPLDPSMFLDGADRYVVRVRIKAGAPVKPQGSILNVGLYSYQDGSIFNKVIELKDLEPGKYKWVRVANIKIPQYTGVIYCAAAEPCAVDKYYVDMVELIPYNEWKDLRK